MSYSEKHNYTTLKEIYKNIDNSILLTSSQILTNHYKNKLNHMAAQDHSTFWQSMPVLQLNLWTKNLYINIDNRKTIASQTHKIMLAYKVIRDINNNLSAKSTMQMARKAIATFNYCQKWHIPYSSVSPTQIATGHSIQKVVKTIPTELSRQNLIDETGIIAAISSAIASRSIDIQKNIVLVGFEYLDPVTLDLIETLSNITNVSWLDNTKEQHQTKWAQSKYSKSAYYDFATWHKTLPQGATVGFFTPNPNDAETSRHAALALSGSHIKSNQSIYDFDIIASALLLLSFTTSTIKTRSIAALLASPHLFSGSLHEKASLADQIIQKLHKYEEYVSISNILNMLQSAPRNETTISFITTIKLLSAGQNSAKLPDHINNFKQILGAAKWPTSQGELEQKIATEFAKLLTSINNNILTSADEAYDIILEMTENHKMLFDNNSAPVQICDIITGSFLSYDYTWIAGLNDSKWPIYSKAKTFIKQHVIEQYTYTEPEQIAMTKNALSRIAKSSIISVYNYSSICDDIAASPSHMIENILTNNEQLMLTNNIQHDYDKFCKKDSITTRKLEHSIPLAAQESSINTYTIKDFNTCHFKSFAKFRLHAKELMPPALGLRPMDKGIIIHNVLQDIYQDLTYLYELKNITTDKITQLVHSNITNTLKYKPNSSPANFIKNERENITTIILAWIKHDLNREDCQIHATEQEITVKLNGITIRGIIDRVDKLAGNKHVIIDYKTGAASASNWFTSTITEPQMPIYSIAYTDKLAAVCYAHLGNTTQFSGIAESGLPQLKTARNTPDASINDIVTGWREDIEQTLKTYATGSIKTIAEETECNKCPYSGICRIWEKNN